MDSTHHLIHGIDYGVEGFVGLAVAPGHDVIVVCVQVQEVVQLFLVVRLIFRNSRNVLFTFVSAKHIEVATIDGITSPSIMLGPRNVRILGVKRNGMVSKFCC